MNPDPDTNLPSDAELQPNLRGEGLVGQSLLSDSQISKITPAGPPQTLPKISTVNPQIGGGGFPPMAAPQVPKRGSKKKLFIIIGSVLGLIIIGVVLVLFVFKASLIGSLTSDTFEGATYQRPSGWVKDTSQSGSVTYHPKSSLGKTSSGESTYALKIQVSAQNGQFGMKPSEMSASDKTALTNYIGDEISKASTTILPKKNDVGCNDDPAYMDNPVRANITNALLDIKYSFVCKSTAGNKPQTFYFKVIDVVPNDKDTEYVIVIGAASRAIYNSNLFQIDKILNSISF